MIKLYHYLHCPFCVRVRLILGYLKIPYKSHVLQYDDEETTLKMIGKKMLPIIQKTDGTYLPESLDIIDFLDPSKKLGSIDPLITEKLNQLGKDIHCLAMPYWIFTHEFSQSSKKYFRAKKESYKGPFNDLYKNRLNYLGSLKINLNKIEQSLKPFYLSENFSINDILLASHLWGMYIVPEFQFEPKVHTYLQKVRELCDFEYHQDCWG